MAQEYIIVFLMAPDYLMTLYFLKSDGKFLCRKAHKYYSLPIDFTIKQSIKKGKGVVTKTYQQWKAGQVNFRGILLHIVVQVNLESDQKYQVEYRFEGNIA